MANTRVTHVKKQIHVGESVVFEHHSAGTIFPVAVDHTGGGAEFMATFLVLEPCDEEGNVLSDEKKKPSK